jgi:hypothetical protein
MVKQIAAGFGLRVLDVSKLGIVMAVVEKQSPFRPILAEHIHTRFAEVEQRLMFGATILTIAAICFPNESVDRYWQLPSLFQYKQESDYQRHENLEY